jgi:Protein of unknown function (DUF551)
MTQDQPLVARLRARSFDYTQTGRGSEGSLLDDAAAGIERLTACLAAANSMAEEFERKWYLQGDEIERLQSALAAQPAPTRALQEMQEMWDELARYERGEGRRPSAHDMRRWSRALSALEATAPTIEQSIEALVSALAESKGWMRSYANSIIRDAIDRTAPTEQAQPVQTNGVKYIVTVVDNEHPNGIPWEQWVRARGHTPPAAQPAEQWPAELSSNMRSTRAQRFNVTSSLEIDDDDFIFDALILVKGDFPEGMKEKYVAEIARRLNGPAEQATQSAWLPIDTAPKDASSVLLSNGVEVAEGGWFDGHVEDSYMRGWWDRLGGMQPEPTHWMPLPAPPQDAGTAATGDGRE